MSPVALAFDDDEPPDEKPVQAQSGTWHNAWVGRCCCVASSTGVQCQRRSRTFCSAGALCATHAARYRAAWQAASSNTSTTVIGDPRA